LRWLGESAARPRRQDGHRDAQEWRPPDRRNRFTAARDTGGRVTTLPIAQTIRITSNDQIGSFDDRFDGHLDLGFSHVDATAMAIALSGPRWANSSALLPSAATGAR
jgi:hypothetical protein